MKILYFITCLLFSSFLHAQVITTIAGNGTPGFSGDGGPATNAQFYTPSGVLADNFGNVYIADDVNNVIHKVDINGILTRFAGTGAHGLAGDGGPATASQLSLNWGTVGLAVDPSGNVYISDGPRIRRVNTSGIITTVAGNGTSGNSGDGGPATAAQLNNANGICFDKAGNLFIADEQNNNIRMVNVSGNISTIAGTGTLGFSGDGGPATNAELKWPHGIAADDSGNIYVADFYNQRIRKVDQNGIITTFAGGNSLPVSLCEGCPATSLQLGGTSGIAIDSQGYIYISAGNNKVRKINKNGLIYTAVGNGTGGHLGDGGPATAAQLNGPNMICFDRYGNLYISEKANYRIRKVWYSTVNVPVPKTAIPQLSIYPNPALHKQFTCAITIDTNEDATIIVTDVLGRSVFKTTLITNTPADITLYVPAGLYFVTAITEHKKMTAKLVVE